MAGGLVFCEEACIPPVEGPRLIKFLVAGNDVIKAPNEVIAKVGKKLLVDSLLSALEIRHQNILCIDEQRRFAGCPVAAFGNAHDLPGHTEMLQNRIS